MQKPINMTPITQFAQLLRATELSQLKELKLPIQQARILSLTILEMADKINQDYESMYNRLSQKSDDEIISVSMDGGGFEEPK